MKRKILALALATAMALGSTGVVALAAENTVETVAAQSPTYVEARGQFFANGTPITIEANPQAENGCIIRWGAEESLALTKRIYIYGGGNGVPNGNFKGKRLESSSVTMHGGQVEGIYGGGLLDTQVGSAQILMTGGLARVGIQGGGGASDALGSVGNAERPEESPNRTDRVSITITGGSGYAVYGGGQGYSYTGDTSVNISDGSWQYVTGGGSNGRTDKANIQVSGGKVDVLQGVNRGSMDEIAMMVTGGEIAKMYVGGEDDESVTGTFNKVQATVGNQCVVGELLVGKNGDQVMDKEQDADKMQVAADFDCVGNSDTLKESFGSNIREQKLRSGGDVDAAEVAKDNFWRETKASIYGAQGETTLKIAVGNYEEFPWTVMAALEQKPQVTLVIERREGAAITIPAGSAQSTNNTRIYWPMELLEKLYR